MTRHNTRRRPGFTLLELLTVLSIMALLTAITASAVARYRVSAMEKQTDQSILKLDVGLQQQIKAVTDKAKNEPIPDNINELARDAGPGGIAGPFDNARARALHMRLKLRQELPQTFDEVWNPVPGYPSKQAFVQAIGPSGGPAVPLPEQAGALLYLILSQGRGGQTFDVDGAAPIQVRTINGRQMKVFVDTWDNILVFRRTVGDAEPVRSELDSPPYVPVNAPVGKHDPVDPNGRLTPPGSNNWFPAYRNLATTYLQNAFQGNPFDGSNRGPYIMSPGRDGFYGNDGDQYSFRIQQYGKGN